jgi:hypothetical protein
MPAEHPRDEVFAYFEAWKPVLDNLRGLYSQLQTASLSGIVLIIATIGFNFENIKHLHAFEKWLLGLALFCLVLALGNLLNCVNAIDFILSYISGAKSRLLLDQQTLIPHDDLVKCRDDLLSRFVSTQTFYRYSFWCFFLAVLLGVACFISILVRSSAGFNG